MAVTAAIAAVVGVGTSIHYSEKAGSAGRESNRQQLASQKAADRSSLRQRQRETRIRQAQILQSASSTGTAGSSGAIGAFGALETMYSANVAQQAGQAQAMAGISAATQKAATYQRNSQYAQQIGGLATSALISTEGFQNLFAQ